MTAEEDGFRLRKAVEFLVNSQESENECRRGLARAVEQTKRAREKFETLFLECESREVARRKIALAQGMT